MTLSFVASATRDIRIGTSVIIVPYRNPIVQAKMFATLDVLTGGRAICGVGVGWLEKEFDVLGASYPDRGPVTDEYLQVFKELWDGGVACIPRKLLRLRRHKVCSQARTGAPHPHMGWRPFPPRRLESRRVR